jgi:dolichol-phosphate mannosyltransferase
VVVVLPAYNEEANIGKLLARLDESILESGLNYEVVVVDDGSTDGTRDILKEYGTWVPLTVHAHQINQGLGATIRDGLMLAAARCGDRDIIVTMDSDETHTPGLILRMVRMVREGYDVVIASRFRPGARVCGVPFLRRCMSAAASILIKVLFPTGGVRDFTCGYRAYRAPVLQQALATYGQNFINQEGFQCMVDILLKLRKLRLIFGEVPLLLRYDLKKGRSKMRVARTARNTLGLLFRRRFGIES